MSKSDFATYAFALLALDDGAASRGHGTVELHLTYDEETGGEIGPRWLLEQELSKPDFAIGAGFSYAVAVAHNGCLHLEVEVTAGRRTRASRETGVDALEAATRDPGRPLRLAARRCSRRGSGDPGHRRPRSRSG